MTCPRCNQPVNPSGGMCSNCGSMAHRIASPKQVLCLSFDPPSLTFRDELGEHDLIFSDPRALCEFWFHIHELMCSVVDIEAREVDVAKVTSRVDPKWCDDEFEGAVV